MEKALYRKYRSRSFDEVAGQSHVTTTLKKALDQNKISHAYLFTGPRGVGKTSVARILAHEVNGLHYRPDSLHLDIIEIDAASNRRIDEIRDLREKVHISPTSARFKVYIIDEAHMLTKEAFNALLKTLEEPPAHCIFILATTEAHKLPETIISRTQRFNFKPIGQNTAESHLSNVAKAEKIQLTAGALRLLAKYGQGSFRDSLSLLDQLSGLDSKVNEDDVRDLLGIPAQQLIEELGHRILNGDAKGSLATLNQLRNQGADPVMVSKSLSEMFRLIMLDAKLDRSVATLLRRLIETPASTNPDEYLEIAVLDASIKNHSTTSSTNSSIVARDGKKSKLRNTNDKNNVKVPLQTDEAKFNIDDWPKVLAKVKQQAPSLYTALRLAIIDIESDGRNLTLNFEFPLHQKKANDSKAISDLETTIKELTGTNVRINCVVDKSKFNQKDNDNPGPKVEDDHKGSIEAISNIFGHAEVLES